MSAKKRLQSLRIKPRQSYESFVRALRLLGLGLEHCSAKLERTLFFETSNRGITREISANYELINVGNNFFNAAAHFSVEIMDKKKKDDDSPLLSIECLFTAHFHVEEDLMNRKNAKQFTDSEFRLVVWPYFRQFVSDTTIRMSIPPVFVPLNLPEPRPEKGIPQKEIETTAHTAKA